MILIFFKIQVSFLFLLGMTSNLYLILPNLVLIPNNNKVEGDSSTRLHYCRFLSACLSTHLALHFSLKGIITLTLLLLELYAVLAGGIVIE